MTELDIQTLLDRAAISDVIHDYAAGLDMKDWKLLRTCFADDFEADFTAALPGDVCRDPDEWVDILRSVLSKIEGTQHIITNHVHDISGDRSKSSAYIQSQHVRRAADGSEEHFIFAGFYDYDMVRTPQGWKFGRYAIRPCWTSGNPALIGLPEAEAAAEIKKSA